jgi:hypothetical protein
MACYDREVNCRRAAASAFQECVGRLGSFPHGLEILAVADYFSVGNAANAYLHVAPFVAQFPEYTSALLQHLADVKLRHWDRALRALAAMGLAALAPVAAAQLAGQALPQLLKLVTDDVLELRTGAVLGIAELLPALADVLPLSAASPAADSSRCGDMQGACLEPAVAEGVVQVLMRLEAAGLYRGKGGELMREAAARLIAQVAAAVGSLDVVPLVQFGPSKRQQQQQEGSSSMQQRQQSSGTPDATGGTEDEDAEDDTDAAAAAAAAGDVSQQGSSSKQQRPPLQLPLTTEYHTSALRVVLDCLGHVQNSIQASGVAALKAHAAAFQADAAQRPQLLALVQQCCSRVTDRDTLPAARRGAAAGLGVLPAGLVGQQAAEVLAVLAAASQVRVEQLRCILWVPC